MKKTPTHNTVVAALHEAGDDAEPSPTFVRSLRARLQNAVDTTFSVQQNSAITPNGHTIAYYTYGSGEPLLLLHGLFEIPLSYTRVIRKLGENYTVYAPAFPGYAGTEKASLFEVVPSKHNLSLTSYTAFIKQFCDVLSLSSVHLVGHRFGGAVGIKLAQEYPVLISNIRVVDPILTSETFSLTSVRRSLQSQIEFIQSFSSVRSAREVIKTITHWKTIVRALHVSQQIDLINTVSQLEMPLTIILDKKKQVPAQLESLLHTQDHSLSVALLDQLASFMSKPDLLF